MGDSRVGLASPQPPLLSSAMLIYLHKSLPKASQKTAKQSVWQWKCHFSYSFLCQPKYLNNYLTVSTLLKLWGCGCTWYRFTSHLKQVNFFFNHCTIFTASLFGAMDTFFGLYFHCLELALEIWAKASLKSLRVHDPNHTNSLVSFQWSGLSDQWTLHLTENCLPLQGERSDFCAHLC